MLTEKQNNMKFLPHQHKVVFGQENFCFRDWNTFDDVTEKWQSHRNNWKLICSIKFSIHRENHFSLHQSVGDHNAMIMLNRSDFPTAILFMVIQFTSFLGFCDDICIIKLSMDMYTVNTFSVTTHSVVPRRKNSRQPSNSASGIKYLLNQFKLFVT